jgi:hypothetical protein
MQRLFGAEYLEHLAAQVDGPREVAS